MPATEWGWQITPEELAAWTVHRDERLLVVNKPPYVVCHPSKHGPWSSLIGAAREWLGVERLHMPSRLDRETSGVVVMTRDAKLASRMQTAIQRRDVEKNYLAVLTGELRNMCNVDQPVGKDPCSLISVKQMVRPDGVRASTVFDPREWGGGYTLARIGLETGRLHQIRVHAAWLGHPVAGDKLYGPDETLFLEFIQWGFTPRLACALPARRHLLHAQSVIYRMDDGDLLFQAPVPEDFMSFLQRQGIHP